MFDELEKYKTNDHFFLWSTDALSESCNAPADKSGVYLVYALKNGHIDLVYIGSTGKMKKAGPSGIQDSIINGKQFGEPRKRSWPVKMLSGGIEALDIYWWVTNDDTHNDDPADIEDLILTRYLEIYGELPKWNKRYPRS